MGNRYAYTILVVFIAIALPFVPAGSPLAHAATLPARSSYPAIDAYIEGRMVDLRIPGLAVAIVRGEQIEYVRGYGIANAAGDPVTPQTPFLIASMSKSFTALGILQLVEAGKIRLDAPVQEYLPWFHVADPEASSRITIRHLLHHSSGLAELEGYIRNLDRNTSDRALEASVRQLSRSPLKAQPGEQFEYSNTNYDILGLVIQTVTGKPYEAYIIENIYAPLKMKNSYTSLQAARLGGLAGGYISFFGMSVVYDRFMPYSRTVTPSAGLFSSTEDMAQYLFAHLNQGRGPNGALLLSPHGIAALHAPGIRINEKVSYGMGWTIFPFPEAAVESDPGSPVPVGLSHGGDWANFKSLMLLIPDHRLGVVMLVNKNMLTHEDIYDNILWNTALLALDLEPAIAAPTLDFLSQFGRWLGIIVVLLLVASFAWSLNRLIFNKGDDGLQRRRHFRIFFVILPVIDLALAGYLWMILLPQSVTTLPLALAFEPDVGIIYLLMLVFTLGWGSLRTVLAVRKYLSLPVPDNTPA